jgi:serine/threonine-protein kinase RsbW
MMVARSHHTAHLTISTSTDNLHRVRAFIHEQIAGTGFTEFEENGIVLAVDEACANLINHAYSKEPGHEIEITVEVDDREVRIEILDAARPFDPSTIAAPDMDAYFRERRVGGLGISLMRRVMDEVRYIPSGEGRDRNRLILTKRHAA